ncbi:hypothetical protein SAMN05444583_103287 [Rhodococcus maanshanensis]|uniref:Uncharacterized protein n=1 Tax=Rhodococcus maanshanensis TaxID=183556 RepID=A0A1H7JV84_9NOCA|nr:hypothetical protein SAMN05444583_103287 [Rhodococcus maanshanensis]
MPLIDLATLLNFSQAHDIFIGTVIGLPFGPQLAIGS